MYSIVSYTSPIVYHHHVKNKRSKWVRWKSRLQQNTIKPQHRKQIHVFIIVLSKVNDMVLDYFFFLIKQIGGLNFGEKRNQTMLFFFEKQFWLISNYRRIYYYLLK